VPRLREELGLVGPGGINIWQRLDAVHGESIRSRQMLRYLMLANMHRDEPDLVWAERSIFSQNGEDGVLLEIFRRLGEGDRAFLEIGAHSQEGNCLALAEVMGWRGTFIDGDPGRAAALARKYRGVERVRVEARFVTPGNVRAVVEQAAFEGRLDLLSIDVDGNDYWIWKALEGPAPRVVLIEYNNMAPPGRRVVQPLSDAPWDDSEFYGASLAAMLDLGRSKGYRLVHADLSGTNLFFVREDLAGELFLPEPEVVTRAANYLLNAMMPPPSARSDWVDLDAPGAVLKEDDGAATRPL
jgi:hypothetical protein